MVVAISSDQFPTGSFKDRAHTLLNNMNKHFRAKYSELTNRGHEGKFPEYREIYMKLTAALADEAFGKFMARFDSGAALWRYKDLVTNDCAELIEKLEERIPRFNAPRDEVPK
jgi:hypothetical protein